MPLAVWASHSQNQAASPSRSVPPGTPEHRNPARTGTYVRQLHNSRVSSARTQSDAGTPEREHPAHFPLATTAPGSQDRQAQTAQEDDPPVHLQWFPRAALESGTWSNSPQQITRSLSPVPRSQSNCSLVHGGSSSPSFALTIPRSPSFQDETVESGEPQVQREATVRPAGASNISRDGSSASKAGFRGVQGLVEWFHLATPRPGFMPGQFSPP